MTEKIDPDAYEYGDGGAVALDPVWPDSEQAKHGSSDLLTPLWSEETIHKVAESLNLPELKEIFSTDFTNKQSD